MYLENLSSWLGRPVADYTPGTPLKNDTIYRFRIDWDTKISMPELFAAYTADPAAGQTTALVIGSWTGQNTEADSGELVQLLVGARHALPKLEAIFFGDIISEENEISWINQTDVSPLFSAYPALKHFVARGGNDLSLGGKMRLESLQSLTIQAGGLPASVLHEVFSMDLPNLESLELWLGTDEYGWDGSVEDLRSLLEGGLFPKLKHLGLRNSQITNQIAEALITAPVLERLESLDLSLGTLTDEGAGHLMYCKPLQRLQTLDLHHHFCTEAGMRDLQKAFPSANLKEMQDPEDYGGPYVAIGE